MSHGAETMYGNARVIRSFTAVLICLSLFGCRSFVCYDPDCTSYSASDEYWEEQELEAEARELAEYREARAAGAEARAAERAYRDSIGALNLWGDPVEHLTDLLIDWTPGGVPPMLQGESALTTWAPYGEPADMDGVTYWVQRGADVRYCEWTPQYCNGGRNGPIVAAARYLRVEALTYLLPYAPERAQMAFDVWYEHHGSETPIADHDRKAEQMIGLLVAAGANVCPEQVEAMESSGYAGLGESLSEMRRTLALAGTELPEPLCD